MRTFIAILSKERRSDYGVHFPDLPGCVTAGKTLEEARTRAAGALSLHLEGMAEEGLSIPEPSALDQIVHDPSSVDGVPFLVSVPDPEGRVVRVNITLPVAVLERIDSYVERADTNRSAFLADAALRRIAAARSGRRRRSKRAA